MAGALARQPHRAAGTTFVCILLLPIQWAVAIGVVLSAILQITRSSTDISLVSLVERPDGTIEERRPPARLAARSVTVLDVYGDLFYAAARTLEARLPGPEGEAPVVVIRLRGRSSLGATIVDVLAKYAERLGEKGGRLYLSGRSEEAHEHLLGNERFEPAGIETYPATSVLGESTRRAHADAQEWLVSSRPPDSDAAGGS